jgi:hypothetical protein
MTGSGKTFGRMAYSHFDRFGADGLSVWFEERWRL